MKLTKSAPPPKRLDHCDGALLAAFTLVAVLGTWSGCLLFNDGAVFLAVAWLGNAWDLYLVQLASRAVSTLVTFGPAWGLRAMLDLPVEAYIVVSHLCYFAVPLVLWKAIRAIEPHPAFSQLYLCVALVLVFFPSELIVGIGLWMAWVAILADPARPRTVVILATAVFAVAMAFTHPATASMSLLYLIVGGGLAAAGLPFPRRTLLGAAVMTGCLLVAFFLADAWLPPGNPTIAAQLATSRYDYIDPVWMLATLGLFPILASFWVLMLAPGLASALARWRMPTVLVLTIGALGLWFAVNGTDVLTWIFARQTAPYVIVLALALGSVSTPSQWRREARLPFFLFACVMAAAALSYGIDMALFSRAVDARLAPLIADAMAPPRLVDITRRESPSWGAHLASRPSLRGYLKWAAGEDYVRDIIVPDYGGDRMTLAFYTYFRSDRRVVLFRPLDRPGEWIPFVCAPIDRALTLVNDDTDRRFLRYCVLS